MKKSLGIILLLLAPVFVFADVWKEPETKDYYNADSSYFARIVPINIPDNYYSWKNASSKKKQKYLPTDTIITPCYAMMFKVAEQGDSLVWKKDLVNPIAPVTAIVSCDGKYLVTFDNWHECGYGDNVMVCYDENGNLIQKYSLKNISPFRIEEYEMSISSIWWRCGAEFFDNYRVKVCFENNGGDQAEIYYNLKTQHFSEILSEEYDAYHRDFEFKPFQPLDIAVVLNYTNPFFNHEEITDYTPYQKGEEHLKFFYESLRKRIDASPKLIGEIDRRQVVKYEKKGRKEAIVYKSYEYDEREPGIWVAYSENKGKTWAFYYTGISHCQPFCLKSQSNLPLFNKDGDLQLEACMLRQITPHLLGQGANYELVKDGLLLTIDFETLRRDTDGDGLTDIAEAKFMTNPLLSDTDNDGVEDGLDLNPRMSLPRYDKTVVFEDLVDYVFADTIPLTVSEARYANPRTNTVMIVTDDPDLQAIQPRIQRIIFITPEELEKAGCFYLPIEQLHVSPMFKLDNEDDTYYVSKSDRHGFWDFIVKRINNGWTKKMVSSGIF